MSLTSINSLLSGLGKPTKRGLKKCFKCGKLNGTKSLTCKNVQCGVVLRASEEKEKISLDAVKLNTGTVRQIYSVRVRDIGSDHRGFVQLPLRNTSTDEDNLLTDVALCFVDSCQRSFDNSILKCHEEDVEYEGNSLCQHIKAALESCEAANPIHIKRDVVQKLQISEDIQMKLFLLSGEKVGPLVQRVSKNVMAVRCQVTPKHPLGYLHFTFTNAKGKETYDRYSCSCAEFVFSNRDKSNTSRYKCIHYYACIWALASNEEYLSEFGGFLNYEIPFTSAPQSLQIDDFKNSTNENMESSAQKLDQKRKRVTKKLYKGVDSKKRRNLMPKIFPVQIKILNDSMEASPENTDATWAFTEWLSYVTECINKTMNFGSCGLVNTQIFHIPEIFYKSFKAKFPLVCLENQGNGMSNEEYFHIMNILHVKEIFDTPQVKLCLSKKFVHSNSNGLVEVEKNESSADYPSSFILFLNVGQSTIDEIDNTNNSFFIEWLPNITSVTKVGQLKLQYKYGRKNIVSI